MTTTPPWIDPELVAMGAWLNEHCLAAMSPLTAPLADCRLMIDRIGAALSAFSPPLKRERDLSIPGPHGAMPCRLYLPDDIEQPPLLVYAHGGSFALGSLSAWDGLLRDLTRQSGVAILSLDYRLAPEHPFPIACDEMLTTIRYAAREGAVWGIDPSRLAVGGDSAGANLALGAAQALRDANEAALSFMLLIYGVYDDNAYSPSWQRLGTGTYGLSAAQMDWIWTHYLSSTDQRTDPRVTPIRGSMHGLPPAHLLVGTLDPLIDENQALAARLAEAGVASELKIYAGLTHGFIRSGPLIRTAARAVTASAQALAQALSQRR